MDCKSKLKLYILFTLAAAFSAFFALSWLEGEADKVDKHFGNCHPANQFNSKPLLLHFKGCMQRFVTFDPIGKERGHHKGLRWQFSLYRVRAKISVVVWLCVLDSLSYPRSVLGPTVTGVFRSLNSSESET